MADATISLKHRYGGGDVSYDDRPILGRAWSLCMDWYDGQGSAFWRLTDDEDVPAALVIAELDTILHSTTSVAIPHHPAAQEFRDYCVRAVARHKIRAELARIARRAGKAGWTWRDFHDEVQRQGEAFKE